MDIPSFFRRKAGGADASPAAEAPDAVQAARTRARRRLVGAAVLVAAGIVGFPLLFETQPRPIPIDVPIEIPRKDGAPPLTVPPARPQPAPAADAAPTRVFTPPPDPRAATAAEPIITESLADAGREVPPPRPKPPAPREVASAGRTASAARATPSPSAERTVPVERAAPAEPPSPPAPRPAEPTKTAEAPKPKPKPPAAPDSAAPAPRTAAAAAKPADAAQRNDAARAQALLEGRPVAAAKPEPPKAADSAPPPAAAGAAPGGGQRFIVQVGAFTADPAVQEARSKVEKLGLKTYTQVAETPAGKRVRVRLGPFASREEAERAAARLKAQSMPAVIISLDAPR